VAKTTTQERVQPDGTPGCAQRNGIHLSLQGKGGVGKSLVASILAQYFRSRGRAIQCIDADPVNRTFAQYSGIDAKWLELMRDGNVDARGFDTLMERLLTEDGTFVIDNSAATFIPLWSYIVENQVIDVLRQAGKQLYVHAVITGGQALLDTLNGFRSLARSTTDRNVIVWINEYFGRVERDGKTFVDMAAAIENADKVLGSIVIPKRNPDTFGRDVEALISRKLTFDEAIADGSFSIMTKQRLKVVQRDLFEQLDRIGV
jgi:hypothetical protein